MRVLPFGKKSNDIRFRKKKVVVVDPELEATFNLRSPAVVI